MFRIFLCFCLFSCAAKPPDPRTPPAAQEGALPVSLTLSKLDGKPFSLVSLRNKPVILYLFTTWCYPCLGEMKALSDSIEELNEAGIEVVGIGLDLEGAKVLIPFAKTFEVPYRVLVGNKEVLEGKTSLGSMAAIPVLFLLDRTGVVVGYRLGVGGPNWLEETKQRALGL